MQNTAARHCFSIDESITAEKTPIRRSPLFGYCFQDLRVEDSTLSILVQMALCLVVFAGLARFRCLRPGHRRFYGDVMPELAPTRFDIERSSSRVTPLEPISASKTACYLSLSTSRCLCYSCPLSKKLEKHSASKGERNMKFVGIWSLRPNMYKSATARFLESAAKPPEGIRTIGRWHYADASGGIHVFECDNAQAITEFMHEWADVLEIDVRPVVEDAEAGAAMAKQAGRS
jgi:Protein of unknown function (DUF3303)